jgi:hypothetical protein
MWCESFETFNFFINPSGKTSLVNGFLSKMSYHAQLAGIHKLLGVTNFLENFFSHMKSSHETNFKTNHEDLRP